jgi:YidC/Oxa1 family membrane protein insertase
VRLAIELTNNGRANISFGGGEQERGLGLIWGPGLGGESNAHNEPTARYATVDAMLQAGDTFLYDHIARVEPGPGGVTPGVQITADRTRAVPAIQWGGIVNKYFLAVVIPDAGNPFASAKALLDNRVLGTLTADERKTGDYPSIEMYGAPFTIRPGQKATFGYTAFIGPKQHGLLAQAGHDLTRAMFHNSFNWMRVLCLGLMALLFWLHGVLGNWGLAIIMLTILVRVAVLPMVHKGMKSQAKMTQQMNRIKPLIDKLNEKYKDDPQRKQQEMFKLYREHNINPLGMLKGCGWIMVQMPIFIGLYMVLYQVIDLRGAKFLWIDDLSQADQLFAFGASLPLLGPYFNLLPIIVAVTQMLTSKFMQTPATDSQQAQMQQMMTWFMPWFILLITYRFPAGLMLYWFVSNLWQVVQQVYVNKVIKKPQAGKIATAA